MATIGNTYLNLIDMMKATEDGKTIATIIELLNATNPILDDAIAIECNMGTFHRHTIRTGLPAVTWGELYKGTPQSKSSKQQVDDTTGFLEALSTVDTRLLDISPNAAGVRLGEAKSFLEAMSQEMASSIFYRSTATAPETILGLSARYGVKGGGGAGNQIVDAGGTGSDNSSIWFVTWGEDTTALLYPKGTQAGIKREDMGKQRILDASGNPFYAMEEKFTWHAGITVKDFRWNARIANISAAAMAAGTLKLYDYLAAGYYKLQGRRVARPGANIAGSPASSLGRTVIYMNRDTLAYLDQLGRNAGASDTFIRLRPMEIAGEEIMTYRGIPIREVDALLSTEARVV